MPPVTINFNDFCVGISIDLDRKLFQRRRQGRLYLTEALRSAFGFFSSSLCCLRCIGFSVAAQFFESCRCHFIVSVLVCRLTPHLAIRQIEKTNDQQHIEMSVRSR